MSLQLCWLRSDLRLNDNRALAAARAAGPVAALYIATPRQWQLHDEAPIKLDYWRRNLQVLEQELQQLGIPLVYYEVPLYRDIPPLLQRILPVLRAAALHCNRELPLYEHRRDEAVQLTCRQLGVGFQRHEDQTLQPPEQVLNKSGLPFKVFTPFSRALRERLTEASTANAEGPAVQAAPVLPATAESRTLDQLSWPDPDQAWAALWPAGEQHALQRLDSFCAAALARYKERRDLPGVDGTSKLSPALAAGVVSVRECWRRASAWQAGEGVHTWQNELLWREFYKHVMWHFPHVNRKLAWRDDVGHVPWRHDHAEFAAWCQGRTGIPIVDAAQRQLLHCGWMHNRLRMLSAMFLTKHLLIDWRWGERWFMQHLVDGDFAANNGGWQWSASTGTDAAPYFRIFNPVTQSRRFDPTGDFIRRYVPELADLDAGSIHEPGLLRPANYPAPMIDLAFGRERALNAFRA